MQHPAPPRSLLFTPANGGRKVEKAFASAADGVILDLEDAVATGEKPAARALAVEALQGSRPRAAYVRVNALGTPFCFDDLLAIAPAAPDAIVLPKVESRSDVLTADWLLTQLEVRHALPPGGIGLVPILETALGIAAAGEIAAASPRLRFLMFGAVDFALDMDLDLDDEQGAIGQARFAVALASRAAGLPGPMDTAFVDIHALDRLRASAGRARAMGYTGKLCIHPAQIETVNAVFTPTEAELARARRIVDAFDAAERAGAAAVSVDGAMIDYPVVLKARRMLDAAGKL
ncbi:MAG: CoA ester lyase [Acetobacteraceae bacterium]